MDDCHDRPLQQEDMTLPIVRSKPPKGAKRRGRREGFGGGGQERAKVAGLDEM